MLFKIPWYSIESKAASMSKDTAMVYWGVSVRVLRWVSTRLMAALAVMLFGKPYWFGDSVGCWGACMGFCGWCGWGMGRVVCVVVGGGVISWLR